MTSKFVRYFFSILFSMAASPVWGSSDAVRSSRVGALICENYSKKTLTAALAWEYEVYDAQWELEILQISTRDSLTSDKTQLRSLQDAAAKSARTLKSKFGYSVSESGVCEKTQHVAWAAAFHGGNLTIRNTKSHLEGAIPFLPRDCANLSSFRSDFAFGRSHPVHLEKLTFKIPKSEQGMVSLVCHGKNPANSPRMLYLFPANGIPDKIAPGWSVTNNSQANASGSVKQWIDTIRATHKLPKLEWDNQILQSTTHELMNQKTYRHERKQLRQIAKQLASGRIAFIGENRVEASTSDDLVWMWWNSPTHRDLLLNADATIGALHLEENSAGKKIAIFVAGKFQG